MSLDRKRWILVDDVDEDISYSGDWFVDTYAKPGPFRFLGSATGGTAHGTNTAGGLAFSFEGTNLVVRGESSAVPLSTNSTVRCTIDGVEGVSEAVNSGLNIRFWQLCGSNTLREGAHQVVVNFTAGPNTIFWVDEIYYMSVASPNLRRKSSMLYPTTSEFRYTGVGWTNPFDEAGHHGRETYETGAKAIIPFYGEKVELVSYMTSSMPRAPGAGTYSIDGGSPVGFEMPAWIPSFRGLDSNDSMFRETVFVTPQVTPGHHTLEVVNLGNASTVPFSIDYFLVHHGDVNANTATATRPIIGTNTNVALSPETTSGTQKNIGVIVGASVGALVVVAAAAFLFFWIRKRRRTRKLAPSSQWSPDESVALNAHPHGFPLHTTPYRDVSDSGGSDAFSPPDYSETERLTAVSPQTVSHYQPSSQQMDMHPFVTPFNAHPAPPLRQLPPEKVRFAPVQPTGATSPSTLVPSPSPAHSHGSNQSPTIPRTLPPPLSPVERLADSSASPSGSLNSQTKSARAVPPRVGPPKRLPPSFPPQEPAPPVYHE